MNNPMFGENVRGLHERAMNHRIGELTKGLPDVAALSAGLDKVWGEFRGTQTPGIERDNRYQKEEDDIAELAREMLRSQEEAAKVTTAKPRTMTALEGLLGLAFSTAKGNAGASYLAGLNSGFGQENAYRQQEKAREARIHQAKAVGLSQLIKYQQAALGHKMDRDMAAEWPPNSRGFEPTPAELPPQTVVRPPTAHERRLEILRPQMHRIWASLNGARVKTTPERALNLASATFGFDDDLALDYAMGDTYVVGILSNLQGQDVGALMRAQAINYEQMQEIRTSLGDIQTDLMLPKTDTEMLQRHKEAKLRVLTELMRRDAFFKRKIAATPSQDRGSHVGRQSKWYLPPATPNGKTISLPDRR